MTLSRRPGDPRRGQRGYMLAMLLAVITIIGIFLTKAMPSVVAEVQRENEAELVFRGEAIAQAVALHKARTGAYPTRLEDLMKVRPRILRQLYKDPMTRDGEWDLITAVQPGATGDTTNLPIVGVRSRSQKDSFRMYKGKTIYCDWYFTTAEGLLGIPGANGPVSQDNTKGNPAPAPAQGGQKP